MTRSMSDTLRAAADLVAQYPDLPPPMVTAYPHRPDVADIDWFLQDEDAADQKSTAVEIIRRLGGRWEKISSLVSMRFLQERDGFNLNVSVERSAVCERVVVGTEPVTIPAVEAQPERVEQREIVEWRCEPVLAEASA